MNLAQPALSRGPSASFARPPTPPESPPTPPASDSDADDASDSVTRPSIFPGGKHFPANRQSPLEEYYGHGPDGLRHLQLLSELKSSRLEGLYNLAFLILCFALAYIAGRNVAVHGLGIGIEQLCVRQIVRDLLLCSVYGTLSCSYLSVVSLALVHLQINGILAPRLALALHLVSSLTALSVFSATVIASPINPLFAGILTTAILICLLKVHSFVSTNQLLAEGTAQRRAARRARRAARTGSSRLQMPAGHPSTDSLLAADSSVASADSSVSRSTSARRHRAEDVIAAAKNGLAKPPSPPPTTTSVSYPNNVTIASFVYFLVAPTLVYETSYPRTDRIRMDYVLWFGCQSVLCVLAQYFLLMQFCVPVFRQANVDEPFQLVWFVFRLALPSFFIFLLMAWGFFHCLLNTVAELLCFADRAFYGAFWNATDLSTFWRTWNLPVHEFVLRHIYVISVERHNVSSKAASLGSFLLSAVLHELVCSVAFKVNPLSLPYMGLGMLFQVPLMEFSKRWRGTRRGNYAVWLTLFLGQPTVTILYMRNYVETRGYLMCE
jgi:branched-subunit amino acid transport protein AzlD